MSFWSQWKKISRSSRCTHTPPPTRDCNQSPIRILLSFALSLRIEALSIFTYFQTGAYIKPDKSISFLNPQMIERMMQTFFSEIEDLGLKQNVDEKNLDLDYRERRVSLQRWSLLIRFFLCCCAFAICSPLRGWFAPFLRLLLWMGGGELEMSSRIVQQVLVCATLYA